VSCQIVEMRAASQAIVRSISKLKTSNVILAVTMIIPKKRLKSLVPGSVQWNSVLRSCNNVTGDDHCLANC